MCFNQNLSKFTRKAAIITDPHSQSVSRLLLKEWFTAKTQSDDTEKEHCHH